jgi:hypothetical protein
VVDPEYELEKMSKGEETASEFLHYTATSWNKTNQTNQ